MRIRIHNTECKRIVFIIIFLVADTSWRWREARRSRARGASGALTPPARLSWSSRWVNLTLWNSSWMRCSLVVSVADPRCYSRILDSDFPSRMQGQKDPGFASKNSVPVFTTQTIVSKLSEIWSVTFILVPGSGLFPIANPGVKSSGSAILLVVNKIYRYPSLKKNLYNFDYITTVTIKINKACFLVKFICLV